MKVKIFWYFEILKIRTEKSHFRETAKTTILEEKQKKIRTTIVAIVITTRIAREKQQRIADVAETVPSCNSCVATIVAWSFTTTVKGGKAALQKEDKVVISPDSGTQRGLGI